MEKIIAGGIKVYLIISQKSSCFNMAFSKFESLLEILSFICQKSQTYSVLLKKNAFFQKWSPNRGLIISWTMKTIMLPGISTGILYIFSHISFSHIQNFFFFVNQRNKLNESIGYSECHYAMLFFAMSSVFSFATWFSWKDEKYFKD